MNQSELILTLDTDWAPDFAIDAAAEMLIAAKVKATWFVTHRSPAIERLRLHRDLFELGIHPNFLPRSTHGADVSEILNHCYEMVPEARSMRTHALVQSTPIFQQMAADAKIMFDSSVYMPRVTHAQPFRVRLNGHEFVRMPIYWEDDLETEQVEPLWQLKQIPLGTPGMKIFDFHPIHLFLNSSTLAAYQNVKRVSPELHSLTEEAARPHIQSKHGTKTLFSEILETLSGRQTRTLSEIGNEILS